MSAQLDHAMRGYCGHSPRYWRVAVLADGTRTGNLFCIECGGVIGRRCCGRWCNACKGFGWLLTPVVAHSSESSGKSVQVSAGLPGQGRESLPTPHPVPSPATATGRAGHGSPTSFHT